MIEEISLKNFRSFRNETIKLKPFSVFIGPNGAGKSNLISIFEFMGRAIREDILVALSHLGDFDSVRHIKANKNDSIEISIVYRQRGEPPQEEKNIGRLKSRKFTYHITVSQSEKGEPLVTKEWLRAQRPLTIGGAPWRYLKVDEKDAMVANPMGEDQKRDEITQLEKSSPYELTLAGSRSLKGYPEVQSFYKFLTNWYISRFEPVRARESMKYSRAIKLASTGENLVLFIENISKYHKDVLYDIIEVMRRIVPGFRKVYVKHSLDGKLYLSIEEDANPDGFPPTSISDGTIRMLGILSILRDPNPPDLICIEEPENNIHPHLLEVLVDEFRTAAEKVQVIVTTHSPYLIDKCKPNEVFVIDKLNGESKIKDSMKWMEGKLITLTENTLGEQWYAGVLGGNP